MKRFRRFLVIFWLISGTFSMESCQPNKLIWSSSNGVLTYNRHTGQFELLWESNIKQSANRVDTVYVCPNDTIGHD